MLPEDMLPRRLHFALRQYVPYSLYQGWVSADCASLRQVLVGCRGGSVLLHELEQHAGGWPADPASPTFLLVRNLRSKPRRRSSHLPKHRRPRCARDLGRCRQQLKHTAFDNFKRGTLRTHVNNGQGHMHRLLRLVSGCGSDQRRVSCGLSGPLPGGSDPHDENSAHCTAADRMHGWSTEAIQ